jgi:hypothetical protein
MNFDCAVPHLAQRPARDFHVADFALGHECVLHDVQRLYQASAVQQPATNAVTVTGLRVIASGRASFGSLAEFLSEQFHRMFSIAASLFDFVRK